MADKTFDERFDSYPYRNVLHEFNSYNYTIVMRVCRSSDFATYVGTGGIIPSSFNEYDPKTSLVIAATGGTYSFPNRWGAGTRDDELGDVFIEDLDITTFVGTKGTAGGMVGMNYVLNVREPNGISFINSILEAYNTLNATSKSSLITMAGEIPVLLSIYFNAESTDAKMRGVLKDKVRHIPIRILTAQLDITSSGAKYQVKGCTYNAIQGDSVTERVFSDKITEISGSTVGQYLEDLVGKMTDTSSKISQNDKSADPTMGEYVYFVRPIGAIAQRFYNSPLSASLVNGGNISNTPMTGVEDVVNAYNNEPSSQTSSAPTAGDPGAWSDSIKARILGGESKGNYNVVVYQTLSGSPTKTFLMEWTISKGYPNTLTDLTLAQVDEFQTALRAKTKGARNPGGFAYKKGYGDPHGNYESGQSVDPGSTGVGAFQMEQSMIKANLGSLKPTDKFSPTNQDLIAKNLYDKVHTDPVRLASTWAAFAKNGSGASDRRLSKEVVMGIINDGYATDNKTLTVSSGFTFAQIAKTLAINSKVALDQLPEKGKTLPAFLEFIKVYPTIQILDFYDALGVIKKIITYNIVGIEFTPSDINQKILPTDMSAFELYKSRTIRRYDYIFTGKNVDILSANISMDGAYTQTYSAYYKSASQKAGAIGATVSPTTSSTSSSNDPVQKSPSGSAIGGDHPKIASLMGINNLSGMLFDPNGTEQRYTDQLPSLVFSDKNFITMRLEIVGDPDLIPVTESEMTSDGLVKLQADVQKNDGQPPADRSLVYLQGFHPNFFYFTVGNPNPKKRANPLFEGMYEYQNIGIHFKSSGAFTMSVTGVKMVQLTVAYKAAVAALENEISAEAKQSLDNTPMNLPNITVPTFQ